MWYNSHVNPIVRYIARLTMEVFRCLYIWNRLFDRQISKRPSLVRICRTIFICLYYNGSLFWCQYAVHKNFHAAAAAAVDKRKKTFKKRQCCRFLQCSLKTPAGTPANTKSGNVAGFLGSVLQRDFINLTLQVFKVRMHVVLKCKLHGCVSK